jgi:hypothetical protein
MWDKVVVAVLVGIVLAVATVLYSIMKSMLAQAQEVYELFVPIKLAGDALLAKLLLEREQIPDNVSLQHEQLDALIELISRLFDDWSGLMSRARALEDRVLSAGTTLLAGASTSCADWLPFITSSLIECQQFRDTFRSQANRLHEMMIEVSHELAIISKTRTRVLQGLTLNESQFDFVAATDCEIYRLKLKVKRFLGDIEPLLPRFSSQSVCEQVREQLAITHPDVDPRQVELVLAAQ